MPVITHAEAYLVDLEVETVRTDALQTFVKQETIFVRISTDDGGEGLGYGYTIGTGGTAVLALLRDNLLARLTGQDPRRVEAIWRDLFLTTKATTVGVITSLALAAIDTALWDWRCRDAGQPLWVLAGGAKDRIPLYDTEGGWLHLSTEDLVAGALTSQAVGWPGIKMKVGRSPAQDAERLGAVRAAVGPDFDVMLDANQSLTAADAIRRARLLEPYDPYWFEEPLPAEDVAGHERLAQATSIPVAVGESMYAPGQFAEYLRRGAAGVIQVDVARIGGITPWLKVAHLAEAANVPVCPHFLMELHVSLCCAVPNSRYLEHIPQLRAITRSDIAIVGGHALAPATPGLGIDWDHDAIDDRRIA
ncbi:putative mandelate racemase [Actinoplanes missouriensis 431]|uniref:Putative mandelate racemase n=1 Tax=Actinoplanes missouriensis (strain ATCC 14538 / DSM 43046 / CBS 188.64 / JCM 3121 / NBRC 102363 / NCIMB 12654 / NRRL B-3342 / UNCC 431) TaxID=512565 RepID=I0H594_ACTM4|nr:mandelate racemase/muconate lactonizing enzyme family protein [Actinoplanes missouriensis]BAL88181.1 putative mandelate racemase [Actinoplanes missouriensis 431]